jgi:hypothetical protein
VVVVVVKGIIQNRKFYLRINYVPVVVEVVGVLIDSCTYSAEL